MAYVYPQDAPVGEQMCKDGLHHWHMVKGGKRVSCCRCDKESKFNDAMASAGPHDDRADAPQEE